MKAMVLSSLSVYITVQNVGDEPVDLIHIIFFI